MSEIRSYDTKDWYEIARIHEENGIDYQMPTFKDFPVIKVLEIEGKIRAAYGLQHSVEAHLWLDRSGWTDAEGKWLTIKALDKESTEAASSLGMNSVLCCVPPGYERFGRRIKDLGFTKIRPGWAVYTKQAGDKS